MKRQVLKEMTAPNGDKFAFVWISSFGKGRMIMTQNGRTVRTDKPDGKRAALELVRVYAEDFRVQWIEDTASGVAA